MLLFIFVMGLFSLMRINSQVTYSCNASATCGCSANSATLSRIVGGEIAQANTWGWIVSLLVNGNLQCGGSILSSTWILTAAHCIPSGVKYVVVYAGSTNRFSGTQIIYAKTAYIHPTYNSSGFINDIAMLELSTPLNLNDPGVDTICLPSVSTATLSAGEWPPPNTTVVAIGWGKLSESAVTSSYTLQQVTLTTVAYQAPSCVPVMIDWRVSFCAADIGVAKGTCQGDSGGPLMMFNQQWFVVGITSYGIGCARLNYSGVYVRVAYYQNWINDTQAGLGSGVSLQIGTNRSTFSIGLNGSNLLLLSVLLMITTMRSISVRTYV